MRQNLARRAIELWATKWKMPSKRRIGVEMVWTAIRPIRYEWIFNYGCSLGCVDIFIIGTDLLWVWVCVYVWVYVSLEISLCPASFVHFIDSFISYTFSDSVGSCKCQIVILVFFRSLKKCHHCANTASRPFRRCRKNLRKLFLARCQTIQGFRTLFSTSLKNTAAVARARQTKSLAHCPFEIHSHRKKNI